MTHEEQLRTIEMNRQQWPILEAFAKQKQWPIQGVYMFIDSQSWKHILTSSFVKTMRENAVTPRIASAFDMHQTDGIDDSGTVMLGYHTSGFTKELWPEWIAFLNAAAELQSIKVPVTKKQAARYGE